MLKLKYAEFREWLVNGVERFTLIPPKGRGAWLSSCIILLILELRYLVPIVLIVAVVSGGMYAFLPWKWISKGLLITLCVMAWLLSCVVLFWTIYVALKNPLKGTSRPCFQITVLSLLGVLFLTIYEAFVKIEIMHSSSLCFMEPSRNLFWYDLFFYMSKLQHLIFIIDVSVPMFCVNATIWAFTVVWTSIEAVVKRTFRFLGRIFQGKKGEQRE